MQGQLIGREYSRANLCGKKKTNKKQTNKQTKNVYTRNKIQEYQIFVGAVGRVGGRRARKICLLPPAFHCYELKMAVPIVSARS